MQIFLANPRGFCAGVERAIEIVERALEQFGAPIYVRHEVVHNRYVVEELRRKGAVFVEELDEIPPGSTVVFSAHGVAATVREDAERRGLRVFDATCPLVTKVHGEVKRHIESGREVILIGHAGHPEVEGTLGQCPDHQGRIHLVQEPADIDRLAVRNPDQLAYVTQTTLSVDDTESIIAALRARFPNIRGPRRNDICYATQNRQDAVKRLARDCDAFIVVGSANSSNSNRLAEIARKQGVPAYRVDGPEELQREWVEGKRTIGVTAGASAPEVLVRQVIAQLERWGAQEILQGSGASEDIRFSLPRALL